MIAEDSTDSGARPGSGAAWRGEVRSGTPVSVVTGGTDGIGRAVALQLACAGHRVIVVGRDTKRGATVVREMAAVAARPQASEPPVFLSADLSSMVATASLANRITALTDRLDALVCCAGVFALRPAWTSEGMERSFALNYLSRFLLINRLLPDLERSPSGRVVLVANAGRYRDTLQLQDLEHGHARRGLRLAGSTQFANDGTGRGARGALPPHPPRGELRLSGHRPHRLVPPCRRRAAAAGSRADSRGRQRWVATRGRG
jgi:NAD(P)-dependent dehydrogenase (short-subunit alcohol dehydrogenase family)